MSDRKTAAELRELARLHGDNWLYLHLAAVEEERERDVETVPDAVHEGGWQWRPTSPSTAFAPPLGTIRACDACGALVAGGPTRCIHCVRGVEDEREDKDAPVERDLRAMTALSEEIRSALNAGPEESTVGAAKRVVQERDSLVGKWKEVDDLTRSRDDWKARHDQVFAEADVKIDELHMKLAKARADLDDAALHETRMNATLEKTAHDAHTAIARAEAAEKRVAELEKELQSDIELQARHLLEAPEDSLAPFAQELRTRILAAGIREGLERAAVRVGDPNTRQTWLEPRFATALAKELRAMKGRVK